MGTNCCWKENKDANDSQNGNVSKPEANKEDDKKRDVKKKTTAKRKSTSSLTKQTKEVEVKKETLEVLEKRSSTASFHSATSFNETIHNSSFTNSSIIDEKYQG